LTQHLFSSFTFSHAGSATKSNAAEKKQRLLNKLKDPWKLTDSTNWPANTVKSPEEMRELALGILERMKKLDTQEHFGRPVLEQFPRLKDSYLRVVTEPMDFGTIQNERIGSYRIISDLQKDLILTFSNCCTYNEKGSEIWNYTFSLFNQLNTVFIETLEEKKIIFPRHWQNTSIV